MPKIKRNRGNQHLNKKTRVELIAMIKKLQFQIRVSKNHRKQVRKMVERQYTKLHKKLSFVSESTLSKVA